MRRSDLWYVLAFVILSAVAFVGFFYLAALLND